MVYDKADEVIQEHFESLFSRYQRGLEKLMKGSEFNFVYICCIIAALSETRWIKYRFSQMDEKTISNNKSYQ